MNRSGDPGSQRGRLRTIAIAAMRARGLDPDFPPDAMAAVAALHAAPSATEAPTRDLRSLLWCSIDNDDSRDLDQLSVAEPAANGDVKIRVAIADVDAAAGKGSPVDRHAALNTTSVYTPAVIFPMLPEKLSTDLTSLNEHQDRLAIVTEFVVSADGSLKTSDVYGALVRNQAKLAYNAVDAWLTGAGRAAAGGCGGIRHGRATEDSGSDGPGSQPRAARARRARLPDHRGSARLRRGHAAGGAVADAEPRQGS